MKKIILSAALSMMLLAQTGFGQFTVYKLSNSTKTEIKAGETVELNINDDLTAQDNIMVELDIKAFRAKYKYDEVVITTQYGEGGTSYYPFMFDEPVNVKRYSDQKKIYFYLYRTAEAESNPLHYIMSEQAKVSDASENAYAFRVNGRYLKDTEEYYDKGVWKKRNIYTDAEPLFKAVYRKKLSDAYYLDKRHVRMIQSALDYSEGQLKNLYYTTRDIKLYYNTGTAAYPQIYKDIEVVADGMYDKIQAMTDKQAAIDQLVAWSRRAKTLAVGKLDKKILKELNKELKAATSFEDKLALFQKYNPVS